MRFNPSANKYIDFIMELLRDLIVSEWKQRQKQKNRSENKPGLIASPEEIAKLLLKSQAKGSFKAREAIRQLPQLKDRSFVQTLTGKRKEALPKPTLRVAR